MSHIPGNEVRERKEKEKEKEHRENKALESVWVVLDFIDLFGRKLRTRGDRTLAPLCAVSK